MSKKKQPPIGFGRTPLPYDAGQKPGAEPPTRVVPPPLVEPIAIDDVEKYEILARYSLPPLLLPAKVEYHLVKLIAARKKRIRELDPNL